MDLKSIRTVPSTGPTRLGIHSVEGFGKTTLLAAFADPVFLASERGFPRDLHRRPDAFPTPKTWPEVFEAIRSLKGGGHRYKTLAIDTMDWLEPLIHRFICERDSGRKTEMNKGGSKLESIEDYGYGKGYVAAAEEFRKLLAALDELQEATGMHIVTAAHSAVKKFSNPAGQDFDRWQPKMNERCARLWVEWCENVVFGYYEVEAGTVGDEKKAKGVSTGKRLLGTRQNAMYDAKNRFGLPDVIDLEDPAKLTPYLMGEHLTHEEIDQARTTGYTSNAGGPPQHEKTEPVAARGNAKTVKDEPPPAPPPKGDGEKDAIQAEIDGLESEAEALNDQKYASKFRKWLHSAGRDREKLAALRDALNAEVAKRMAQQG